MKETEFYESLLGLSGIQVDGVIRRSGTIEIYCHTMGSYFCTQCGIELHNINQYTERRVRDLDIVGKEVWLIITLRQYYCPNCKKYTTERLGFADSGKSYTHRQAKWIFDLCAQQPFSQVGALINMCSKTVENLYYQRAEQMVNIKERYLGVTCIGIDEIAHRKGKRDFCCVITDLVTGRELDILPDRKKETIIKYFKDLGSEICHNIKVLACDIWATYIQVAEVCFPNALVVLDRFHVVKALNDALDTFRKQLRQDFKDIAAYKNIKWLLFKQPKNCNVEQKQQLQTALNLNKDLNRLYELRNLFNRIYDTSASSDDMKERLNNWLSQAKNLNLDCLNDFIKTLKKWIEPIANFATNHVTNAATEGLNNLIRHFKRLSFGLPNFHHMRFRVLLNSH